jgi:thiamine pyrophosphate-dependent acetolactate synthase large subunit-like protein
MSERDEHPEGARIVHVNSEPDLLNRIALTDLVIASDIRGAIRDLSDALDGILTKDRLGRIRSERLKEVSAFTSKLRQAREEALRARFDHSPLSWERVGYELEKILDKDAVIVPENGTQDTKLLSQLKLGGENKLRIGRTAGSALGWGIGAALGVNLALPERQIVALQGDGGFMFGQSETLWSISRYDAPMLIIIMNNRGYNETRIRNMNGRGAQYMAAKDLTSFLGSPDIDFTKIAEAYNIKGEKVSQSTELAPALQRALKIMRAGRPVLLDIRVAREGTFGESEWHQRYSISEIRDRKLAGA